MSSRRLLWTDSIKSYLPKPLFSAARSVYRTALNISYAHKWLSFKQSLKQEYGKKLKFDISPTDEMYQYFIKNKGEVSNRAHIDYFNNGRVAARDLERIVKDLGITITPEMRILEFASGCGKVTRFLITHLDPGQVTVSDIDHQAVDFNTRTFHTRGFYSVTDPADLEHCDSYDLILVVSLFSHLPQERCDAWLMKLISLLKPGGMLIFSTHGMSIYDALPPQVRENETVRITEGFYYRFANETFGRLSEAEYGTTYMDVEYIRKFLKSRPVGALQGFFPRGIGSYQDVYAIQKARPARARQN